MTVLDRFRLDGRRALVTGGTKGLGRAMALALAEAGAEVAVCSRNAAEAEEAAHDVQRATGRRSAGFEADVSCRSSVVQLAERCRADFGSIDILINNAGINIRKPTTDLTEEDWHAVLDISVTGSFFCSQVFMPPMVSAGWGRVVMLGSIMSYVSLPGRAAYATAKTALLGLTRTLALEGASAGVTVNCLCPGPFDTPMNQPLTKDPEAYKAFLAKLPVGRWGDPEELACAAVYLCSPGAAFVTGAALVIDGGWTLQ